MQRREKEVLSPYSSIFLRVFLPESDIFRTMLITELLLKHLRPNNPTFTSIQFYLLIQMATRFENKKREKKK